MALNTKTSFSIAGQRFDTFHSVELTQNINGHHEFEVLVSYDWFEGLGKGLAGAAQSFLGEEIEIQVEPIEAAAGAKSLIFKGLVTSITSGKRGGDTHGFCVIKGYSPSILLDDDPHIESFEQKSLADIVNATVKQYPPNMLRASIDPETKESLKYTVQYKESSHAFIKRLAERHGEWFFYDGQQLVFGKRNPQKTDLTHQVDLQDFDIELSVQPHNMRLNGYDYRQDEVVEDTTSSKQLGKLNAYSQHAQQVSSKLYSREGLYKMNYAFNSNAKAQINQLAMLQKKGKVAKMVVLKGSSTNPGLRIGDTVSIKESALTKEQHHGEYMLTDLRHYCSGDGTYYNIFEGIPADAASPSINLQSMPYSEPQSATVIDNNDPKGLGRIKVKFRWQQQGQTPWVRVVSAAGGGDKGLFMMPELGEEVIVDFEGGNPEQPYAIGSTYNGKAKSSFGGAGNNVKALKTRSGNIIQMDDAAGSITVTDKNGSTMAMDGTGNITVSSKTLIKIKSDQKIEVDAPDEIKYTSKRIIIEGSETVEIGKGDHMLTIDVKGKEISAKSKTIRSKATTLLKLESEANMKVKTDVYELDADTKINHKSKEVNVSGDTATNIKGGTVFVNC